MLKKQMVVWKTNRLAQCREDDEALPDRPGLWVRG